MNKLTWFTGLNNFGDDINPVLFEKLSGKPCRYVPFGCKEDHYIMCGSILNHANKHSIVWGAGFINRQGKTKEAPKEIHAVRGKLSRLNLLEQGIECPKIYGDPVLLMPRFYNPDIKKKYKSGYVPHYAVKKHDLPTLTETTIDIQGNIYNVIDRILECEKIYSSSLHGLIVAHAYGIKATWVQLPAGILCGGNFKFIDYYSSIHEIDTEKLYEACPFKRNR